MSETNVIPASRLHNGLFLRTAISEMEAERAEHLVEQPMSSTVH